MTSTGRGSYVTMPHCYRDPPSLPPLVTSGVPILEDMFQTCSLEGHPPPVLTSGGHWSIYSWQADGTDPTGRLSYKMLYLKLYIFKNVQRYFYETIWNAKEATEMCFISRICKRRRTTMKFLVFRYAGQFSKSRGGFWASSSFEINSLDNS